MKTPRRSHGFTLIELIAVIAIISLLATLSAPSFQKAVELANSMRCGNNLRQIGIAVLNAAHDNDNKYPKINDPAAESPFYPEDPEAKYIQDALAAYGADGAVFKCPSDLKGPNAYKKYGSSYQWNPMADGETDTNDTIKLYMRRGQQVVQVSSARIRIVSDYERLHFNRWNTLYADGHVNVRYN